MPIESNEGQQLFLDSRDILHVFNVGANGTAKRVRLIRDWSEIEMVPDESPAVTLPATAAEDGLELLKGLHGKQPASNPQAQNKAK